MALAQSGNGSAMSNMENMITYQFYLKVDRRNNAVAYLNVKARSQPDRMRLLKAFIHQRWVRKFEQLEARLHKAQNRVVTPALCLRLFPSTTARPHHTKLWFALILFTLSGYLIFFLNALNLILVVEGARV